MNSYSTSLKTGSGGVGGRALSAGDEIFFKAIPALDSLLGMKDFIVSTPGRRMKPCAMPMKWNVSLAVNGTS